MAGAVGCLIGEDVFERVYRRAGDDDLNGQISKHLWQMGQVDGNRDDNSRTTTVLKS